LFLYPERTGLQEGAEPPGRHTQVGFENPFELEQRLVVKADESQVPERDPGGPEAVLDRVRGQAGIPFLSGETLLLRRGGDPAVGQKTGGAVMVEGGDAENMHGDRSGSLFVAA